MPAPDYEAAPISPDTDCHVDYAIRSRAYALWEEVGRPEGMHPSGRPWAEHFWLKAEAELSNESAGKDK
jgi:hypothetical protein